MTNITMTLELLQLSRLMKSILDRGYQSAHINSNYEPFKWIKSWYSYLDTSMASFYNTKSSKNKHTYNIIIIMVSKVN